MGTATRRGWRTILGATALAGLIAACGGTSTATPLGSEGTPPGTSAPTVGTPSGSGTATAPAGADARPAVLVAVTAASNASPTGALVVLDPVTGHALRTLDPVQVLGESLQLTPDRSTVYYEKKARCQDEVWRVAVAAGGVPEKVVDGARPALSPDGTRLAYATEPLNDDCLDGHGDGATFAVAVRTLATGAVTRLTLAKDQWVIPSPVGRLSWDPTGTRLAVSITSPQDNEGWGVRVVTPGTDHYYLGLTSAGTDVTPVGPGNSAHAEGAYVREAVFLPGGDLFAVRRCCTGWPPVTSSELLQVLDPATGALKRQVAIGKLTADHTGLTSDRSGRWLLYLSGKDVMVAHEGAAVVTLTSGYDAVAW